MRKYAPGREFLGGVLPLLLAAGAVLLTIPLVLGFLGGLHPAFDSFAHFRVHLAVLVIALALPLLFYRDWRSIGLAALVLAVASIASVTVYDSGEARADVAAVEPEAAARYRLLQLNLRYDNQRPKEVLSLIGRVQPDIVTLDEVSPMWRGELELIEGAYPHRLVCPSPTAIGGVAIFSRRPFLHPSTAKCYDRGALAVATVDFGGTAVDIVAIHLGWPWPFEQPWQIGNIRPILERVGGTAILAGDLNAAPWSAIARQVASAGGMTILGGIGPTWLKLPLPGLLRRTIGLPIDNILVKGGVIPLATKRLDDVGSDHLPVLFEFSLQRRDPAEVQQVAL